MRRHREIALVWTPQNHIKVKSKRVQGMSWCRQRLPNSVSPYGVSRPRLVNTMDNVSADSWQNTHCRADHHLEPVHTQNAMENLQDSNTDYINFNIHLHLFHPFICCSVYGYNIWRYMAFTTNTTYHYIEMSIFNIPRGIPQTTIVTIWIVNGIGYKNR